ncbi:hypothetical protein TWF481_007021 [Arthrobotrys musiformis]|uniref:Helicase C-terminal domain-containing protein n=1 Tax=Arthrobotrys musiformis TaxID=47236 RepID=A0AAV9WA82_9PEZI
MPRKGVSAKRRLSNESDEEPVQAPAPELTAQNEQLRRTRSRMVLRSAPSQTQQIDANPSASLAETSVYATASIPVPDHPFSGVGLLQALPNASNVGPSTAARRTTRSRFLGVGLANENVPPPLGKRKRNVASYKPEAFDDAEFGTPDILDDDDESDFEEDVVCATDSDDGYEDEDENEEEQQPSHPAKGKSSRSKPKASSETWDNPGATLIRSTPINKWSDSSMEDLPPLSDIDDIFADLTKNHSGLVDVANHLNGRPLRVATMCSGTESPLLALGLMIKHLSEIFGAQMTFEHLFSCEIEPFKQAYIERNFHPKLLFRDVCELKEEYATTAYGSKAKVPGDCDILVAGTSCVDYSNLNNHGKGLQDGGESGRTFYGMLGWVIQHKPKIVILENVCQAPWGRVIAEFERVGYVAGHSRFDTKNFYIPHTRQRGYLVAFLNGPDTEEGLPEKWVEMVNAKTRPASVSFEEFCLEDDHPKVVEIRVKLQDEVQKSKGVEWIACEHRHEVVRSTERLGRQRPFTGWQENGKTTCPDNAWRDWIGRQVDRVKDLMDINYLRSAARGIDLVFVARVHNLSQNADRNTEGRGNGITQCLTPTMIPYSTYRGGPLIGIELLSLQGLPTDQLLFTRETEANLKDLAGNAMSSTVVGTAMAAALVVGMKLLGRGNGAQLAAVEPASPSAPPIAFPESLQLKTNDSFVYNRFDLKHLKNAATKSARKCVCEARTLTADKIQICKACGHTSCKQCGIKPQHEYEPLQMSRREPFRFENIVKELLPVVVRFKGVKDAISHAILHGEKLPIKDKAWDIYKQYLLKALSSTFTFSSMKRKEVWVAKYDSSLGRLDLLMGSQQFEWRLFVKADRSSNDFKELRRLFTPHVAHMIVDDSKNSFFEGTWRIGVPGTAHIDVEVEGVGEKVDSWERSLGLKDPAFTNKMVYPAFKIFLTNVKEESLLDADITGQWDLLPHCGTACRALHSKVDKNGEKLFLFIDPHRIGDGSNDYFVVARDCKRLEFGEYRPIIAKFDAVFRPDAKVPRVTTQVTVNQFWKPVQTLRLKPSGDVQTEHAFSPLAAIASHDTCSTPIAFLASRTRVPSALSAGFPNEWKVIDEFSARKTFQSINWIVEGLEPSGTGECWMDFGNQDLPTGCGTCAPKKPTLSWGVIRDKMALIEDPEESAVWERAMKARPKAWVTAVKLDHTDGQSFLLLNIGLNVVSLRHRAADLLPGGIGLGYLSVTWRLTPNYVSPPRLHLPAFTLKSNRKDQESTQPPNFLFSLRPEQLRSLTWMISQESPDAPPFIEQEVAEALHPQLPWKADVRATRPNNARGGVLADAVGYGKTAITLGLLTSLKDSYVPPQDSNGRIPIKGTLIIVPSHLVEQWASEIAKFTGKLFKVVVIKTMGNMKSLTIKDIIAADIILIPMTLLKSPLYLERLAEFSGGGDAPAKEGRRFQQWLDDCKGKLGPQIHRLQSGDTTKVLSEINDGYAKRKEAKDAEQLLGRKAHNKATTAAKRKSTTKSPQTSDTEVGSEFEDEHPKKKARAKPKPKKPPVYEDQNWRLKTLKGNWKGLHTPLFEFFWFNRVVVDEFTYCTGAHLHIIPGLLATSRWVLSGTPALGDFDDVKKIAVFLGIRLGIDDDIVNSDINNKRIARGRSAVEAFHAFHEAHTPNWHEDRHSHAQYFLDAFMRQNVAEIDEIPSEEFWTIIKLPAAEKAIYVELDHHLTMMEMNILRKGNSKGDGDRDKRLRSAIGGSTSAEEALLKSLCHFSLNIGELDSDATAHTACDHVVKQREHQLSKNKEELLNVLKAALVEAQSLSNPSIPKAEDPFLKFIEQKRKSNLEDAAATLAFREILQQAKDLAVHERKKKKPKRAPRLGTDEDMDMDVDADEFDDDGNAVIRTSVVDANTEYREAKIRINRLLKELVGRFRSLRFFEVVRKSQTDNPRNEWACACGKRNLPLESISVSSICGHSACSECMARSADRKQCPEKDSGCESLVQPANIIPVASLGAADDTPTTHGAKLDQLIHLLTNVIPVDEKVLLFIQFPDLLNKVVSILQAAGVSVTHLAGSARDKSSELTLFQTSNASRVLVLEAMGETAAGANLTVANHVVFLSPIFTLNEQQYTAAETQAIGRVRRYGQKKKVSIWRLVVDATIDRSIYDGRKPNVPKYV